MATEFNWRIAQLERNTADGVVFTAHYTVDAKDEAYSAGAYGSIGSASRICFIFYGSIGLEQPDPTSMIPFSQLTEETVIDWVKEKLGGDEKVEEIEAALQAQLDEQHAPTKAAGLPWAG